MEQISQKLSHKLQEDGQLGVFFSLVIMKFSSKTKTSDFIEDYFNPNHTIKKEYWVGIRAGQIMGTIKNDLVDIIRTPGFDKIPPRVISRTNFISGDFRRKMLALCKIYKD